MDKYRSIASEAVDLHGVNILSTAMKTKLQQKRAEGRSGWNRPDECTIEHLRQMLAEHVEKGDLVDIANFCMMIWNRENEDE